mgnify:FL=1
MTNQAMGFLATKPVMIITTRHASGVVNAGVFGAYTNLSPDHVGVAVATTSHTYANMIRSGEFVINIPGADLVKTLAVIADDIPETVSEVEQAGLTLKEPLAINTPSIAQCQAALEFAFDRDVPIGRHHFMVGVIKAGWIRTSCLDADGRIDIHRARVMKDFKYPAAVYVLPGEIVQG